LDHIEFLTEGLFISSNIKASQKDIDKAITSPKDRKLSYGIATEMDMVVLNHKTGEKHLVDFKTVRVDPNNKYKQTPEGKLGKSWDGKPSKADGYSKQQNASAILTNLNEEIEFDTISLLPIQVWYPEKGQSTDIAKVSTESLALSKEDIEDVFPKEYADQLKSSAPQTSEVERREEGEYIIYEDKNNKSSISFIKNTLKDGTYLQVNSVDVPSELQGKGIGMSLYTNVLNNLPTGVLGIVSGTIINPAIKKIYKNLEKDFNVKKIKNTYIVTLNQPAQQSSEVTINNKKWTKNSPKENPNTAYVFTENINSIGDTRVGGGSAVIRNNPNAVGIVTKKYYTYKENRNANNKEQWNADFQDTDADFELFKKVNLEQFAKLDKFDSKIFPDSFANSLAAVPNRFALWLQNELQTRYGLVTEVNSKGTGLISKSVQPAQQTTEVETGVVDFKPEDITVSNKLETFEVFIGGNQENGTVGIKGYKIDIKNQPNVNLIATKYHSDAEGTQMTNGWQVLELKGGLRLPMTGAPGGAVLSKKDISLELPITLNNVQDTGSNKKILEEIGFDFNVSSSVIKNVTYAPKGKKKQLYTISGNKIFNSKKIEVFKTDSVDRNKIFANLAIKEGRAKKVTFKGTDYIVNNKEQIISTVTGKIMNWGPENGNRRAILSLYNRSEEQVATPKPSTSDASAAFGIPTEELDVDELKKWKNINNDSNNPFEEC